MKELHHQSLYHKHVLVLCSQYCHVLLTMQFNAINNGRVTRRSNEVLHPCFPSESETTLESTSYYNSTDSVHVLTPNERDKFCLPVHNKREHKNIKNRPKAAYKFRTPHKLPLPILKTYKSVEVVSDPQNVEDVENEDQLSSVGSTPSDNTIPTISDCIEVKNETGPNTKNCANNPLNRAKISSKHHPKPVIQGFPQIANTLNGESLFIKTNRIPFDKDDSYDVLATSKQPTKKSPFSVSFSLIKNEVIEDFQEPESNSKDFKTIVCLY